MGREDLTVIILSYNTKAVTDICLRRIRRAQRYCEERMGNRIQTIVIEQGSSDGSLTMIREKYPWVKLVALKENVGFTRGNNLGMRRARTPYLLVMNNDVYVEAKTIFQCVEFMERRSDCGVLTVGLRYPDGRFQPSGGYLPNPLNTLLRLLELDRVPLLRNLVHPIPVTWKGFWRKEREIGWASGAFLFLRREVFEATGGFDERLFWYGDDLEWAKRIHDKGFRIFYTPSIVVTHVHGASSKGDVFEPYRKQLEGYLYFNSKYYPRWVSPIRFVMRVSLLGRSLIFSAIDRMKAEAYRSMVHRLPKDS